MSRAAVATVLLLCLAACEPAPSVPTPPPGAAPAPARLTLTTLEWEPWVGQALPQQGISTAVVRAALEAGGAPEPTLEFLPWKRALAAVEHGRAHAVYPAYHVAARERYIRYSAPMVPAPIMLLGREGGAEVRFDGTIRSLEGLRIGVVDGYANTPEFDAADYLTRDPAGTDLQNLEKLLRGRVDVIVIDLLTARTLIAKRPPDQRRGFVEHAPYLQVKWLHLGFSRALPDSERYRQQFERGFRAILADGRLEALLERHGLADALPLIRAQQQGD